MRVLLAQNSLYYPSHGGGDKSNRLLMEALAARGHAVRVAARIERFETEDQARFLDQLASRGVVPEQAGSAAMRFERNGVEVRTLTADPHLRAFLAAEIAAFGPDVILTSTDDPAQILLETALRSAARVVHLVRATIAVPFGPDSSSPNARRTEALRAVDGVVGVSEYVAHYVREWSGLEAIHVPISLLDPGEPADLGSHASPYVTLANPCAVKGISIFLALARNLPRVRFAAVPTWGTNAADMAALEALPNVRVLPPADNIDEILRETRVLLVPSLWAEARSRIVPEAMARGVPVMASDIGGLPEAKLGVPYLIPVNPIRQYRPAVDENMVPVAEVPEQNVQPWMDGLRRLLDDPAHWHEISRASREAALAYVDSISVQPFERYLFEVLHRPKKAVAVPAITDERQRLLALKLKRLAQRTTDHSWFPGIENTDRNKTRLFCFPWAGGGTSTYRTWEEHLPVAVCPVRLPGRETRASEPLLESMTSLIDALTGAIAPYLDAPFVFFGHSMGAGIAFELSRRLRRDHRVLPGMLLVSALRAPQLRRNRPPGPEPSEEEFREQMRRLGGLPENVTSNPEIFRLATHSLRADARLVRTYTYRDEPPLEIPIVAYGGTSDPQVGAVHLEAWREQTTTSFQLHMLSGGHFYFRPDADELLKMLGRDLANGARIR